MKTDDRDGDAVLSPRPRTTTGQIRSMSLMMEIAGDAAWRPPNLTVTQTGDPPRDVVCVTASSGEPGLEVAYYEEGRLWVIVLPDEERLELEDYALLVEDLGGERRWPERVLYAARSQRIADEAAA